MNRGCIALALLCVALAFGQSCSPLQAGKRGANDPFWLENDKFHNGVSAFGHSGYPVFRNVKSYGAKGDGVTDDTVAINAAITDGSRCGVNCDSSTVTPALVYFPSGNYVISGPLIQYYFTQFVGDANNLPTITAASNFQGTYMIQSDPYGSGGNNWFTNQNNFFRQVRNFVIDTRRVPATTGVVGIHWQVAQATSITNVVINLNQDANTKHQGIWMENGSSGYFGDIIINGGLFGMWVGNQQYTNRNITFNNCQTAIFVNWCWAWSLKSMYINNCGVGLDISTPNANQQVGSVVLLDSVITNTPVAIKVSANATTTPVAAGTLTVDNLRLVNVKTAILDVHGNTIANGGDQTIASWGSGHRVSSASQGYTIGALPAVNKANVLLNGQGAFFERTRPQYQQYTADDVINVKSEGAVGDGHTDDTSALSAILKKYAGCKIIYFPAGTYLLTSTLYVPPGSRIVGQTWSQLSASGNFFSNFKDPKVMVKVGNPGESGVAEISDILFTTAGPTSGAILVEWNIRDPAGQQGVSGMWDSHFRVGGAAGTQMGRPECPSLAAPTPQCMGAFMLLHLTATSSAYLENVWAWTADHDLDGNGQTSIFTGRGVLVESQLGPVWMYGVASEHNVMYQFNLQNARNVFMSLPQTETPYYQGTPQAPAPFVYNAQYRDPQFNCASGDQGCGYAWGLNIAGSNAVYLYAAGLYNFFNNYNQTCLDTESCQNAMINIDTTNSATAGPGHFLFNVNTKAASAMIMRNGKVAVKQGDHRSTFCSVIQTDLTFTGSQGNNPVPTGVPTINPPTPTSSTTKTPTPTSSTTKTPAPTSSTTKTPTPTSSTTKAPVPTTTSNQFVYLRSNKTGKFVTIRANRDLAADVDGRAAFEWFVVDANTTNIRDAATKQYVSAESGGAANLVANRGAPSGWESFMLIKRGNQIQIVANINKKYVAVQNNGALLANSNEINAASLFTVHNS